jgi:hypothetical protein
MNAIIDDIQTLTNSDCCKIAYDAIILACGGKHYEMSLVGRDADVVRRATNMGIDSRLQICYCHERGDKYYRSERSFIATEDGLRWKKGDRVVYSQTLECRVSPESLPVLIRRLFEDMEYTGHDDDDADVGNSLASSILETLGFDDDGRFRPEDS